MATAEAISAPATAAAGTSSGPDANGIHFAVEGYAVAGQLTPEQIKEVHDTHQFKTWINVLGAEDSATCQKCVASASGGSTTYINHALSMPDGMTPATARALEHALHFAEAPVLVQCASATRASAVLALHMADKNGWNGAAVLEWAGKASLKFAAHEALSAWVAERADTRASHEVILAEARPSGVIFRQLFDRESCTYTYLLGDAATKEAVLIDPVDTLAERDATIATELGLKVKFGLNTHAHADHITGTGKLKALLPGMRSVLSAAAGGVADVLVEGGDKVHFGGLHLTVLSTPGHTAGCVSFLLSDGSAVFTGDALMVRGCGRTDFQGGSAETLYTSVNTQLFSLPDTTAVYPAHDYKGRTSSTVGEEKAHNPRLKVGTSQAAFVDIMDNLNLSRPKLIDVAVPANLQCGLFEVEGAAAAAQ